MITSRIEGHVIGMTWGSVRCSMEHRVKLKQRGLVKAVMQACKSGDFQYAKFCVDSFLVVESRTVRNRCDVVRTRTIALVDLPSLSEFVDPTFSVYGDDE